MGSLFKNSKNEAFRSTGALWPNAVCDTALDRYTVGDCGNGCHSTELSPLPVTVRLPVVVY